MSENSTLWFQLLSILTIHERGLKREERLAGDSSGTGRGEESTILRDCEKEREKDRRSLLNCGTAGDLALSAVAAAAAEHD